MSKTPKERLDLLYDNILGDILNEPLDRLSEELLKDGCSLEDTRIKMLETLEKAQEQVISEKISEMNAQQSKVVNMKTKKSPTHVTSLTLAARNANRPLGFSDPSVDEDLKELRSADWDNE